MFLDIFRLPVLPLPGTESMALIAARETQSTSFTENPILHTTIFGRWSRSQGAFRGTSSSSIEGHSCRADSMLWLVSWMHTLTLSITNDVSTTFLPYWSIRGFSLPTRLHGKLLSFFSASYRLWVNSHIPHQSCTFLVLLLHIAVFLLSIVFPSRPYKNLVYRYLPSGTELSLCSFTRHTLHCYLPRKYRVPLCSVINTTP